MEVAALISSINPAINANYDSIEVGGIQQELLWLLYDSGYLKHYPMALGNHLIIRQHAFIVITLMCFLRQFGRP